MGEILPDLEVQNVILHKIADDLVEMLVDLETSSVVQITNRRSGAKHLLSRKPELALKNTPPMGIVELEPSYCSNWSIGTYSSEGFESTCQDSRLTYTKRVSLNGGVVRYTYCVKNELNTPLEARLRVAIYLACGKGGFWGDEGVLGSTSTCRYYVSYGYAEDWGSFSTSNTPGTPRGFAFEKHSYRSRWFPELKWIAVVDKDSSEGLAIRCLNTDCYGVVEDQFFNVEVNLAIPRRVLSQSESVCLSFELTPFSGVRHVDYVDDGFIIGVEGPSVALPGSRYEGFLAIFPLRDGRLDVNGKIVFVRGMQSIGKRGYCVDRVTPSKRVLPLVLESQNIVTKRFEPYRLRFESPEPLGWEFERELYEIPYLVFSVNGREVKRAISINPDVEDAVAFAPGRVKKLVQKLVEDNPAVESEFMEREASKPIYELVFKTRFNPRKILQKVPEARRDHADLLLKYLEARGVMDYVKYWQERRYDPLVVSRTPVLELALYYVISKSWEVLRAFENYARSFSELVFDEKYATYFSPIHGGGGVDRLADLVLALDLVEDEVDRDVVEDLYTALALLGREISKISNTWTGNWELSESVALLAIACKLGYPGHEVDIYRAVATAKRALGSFLPDGAWPELAPSYHAVSLGHLIKIGEISTYTGVFDVYRFKDEDGNPVMKKALVWLWETATPRNTAPSLEDTNEFVLKPDLFLVPGLHLNDSYLLGVAFRLLNQEGLFSSPFTYLRLIVSNIDLEKLKASVKPPARRKIVVFKESGRFVYRESENADAMYFILDFGPHGGWHGHPDRLSFELYYRGVPVVVDAGSGGYYNPLHWTWSRKSIAHNTVTRGSLDHHESYRGYLKELRELENGFYATFTAGIDETTVVERRVFVNSKDRVLLLLDRVRGSGVFRWNIHCRGVVEAVENNAVVIRLGGFKYIVVAPENVTLRVDSGFRGSEELVPYIHYEVSTDVTGELWGGLVLEEVNTGDAIKKINYYVEFLKRLAGPSP